MFVILEYERQTFLEQLCIDGIASLTIGTVALGFATSVVALNKMSSVYGKLTLTYQILTEP